MRNKARQRKLLLNGILVPLWKIEVVKNAICNSPEVYESRQTEHVSDLPGVAVIVNDHLVFGCSNTRKTMIAIYVGY